MASSFGLRSSQRSEKRNRIPPPPHGRSAAAASRSLDNLQQLTNNNLSVRSKIPLPVALSLQLTPPTTTIQVFVNGGSNNCKSAIAAAAIFIDVNQENIVEEGGLDALLMLLQSCQNIAVLRAASGAIANLAMNEMNQCLIMNKGGARLLASTASKTDDPQALRMVAGAIANLCGNEKFHLMLRDDGAIKALLGMARSGNSYVIAQVARGIANFAKCESRDIIQGHRRGCSVLIEDDVLSWLIVSSTTVSASSRRHFELALCHLAQNEDNARDFISSGGVKALARISVESSREDIRNLAKKTQHLKQR